MRVEGGHQGEATFNSNCGVLLPKWNNPDLLNRQGFPAAAAPAGAPIHVDVDALFHANHITMTLPFCDLCAGPHLVLLKAYPRQRHFLEVCRLSSTPPVLIIMHFNIPLAPLLPSVGVWPFVLFLHF